MKNSDPYILDWGKITPDGYNANEKTVIHVFNFDISSNEKIMRCIVFSIGKIIWSNLHINSGLKQKIVFDLRGQPLAFLDRFRKMKEVILKGVEDKVDVNGIVIECLI